MSGEIATYFSKQICAFIDLSTVNSFARFPSKAIDKMGKICKNTSKGEFA